MNLLSIKINNIQVYWIMLPNSIVLNLVDIGEISSIISELKNKKTVGEDTIRL